MLAKALSKFWWMTLLRGLLWILFGIVVISRPGISLVTLTLVFGGFAFADGIANIVTAFGERKTNDDWWALLLAGLAGVGVGVLTFMAPGITALSLLYFIALWSIASGLMHVVTAIRLRKQIEGEFWLILSGLLAIAFGMLIVARPGAGALSVLFLIGCYAIAGGVIIVAFAIRARGFVNRLADLRR